MDKKKLEDVNSSLENAQVVVVGGEDSKLLWQTTPEEEENKAPQ